MQSGSLVTSAAISIPAKVFHHFALDIGQAEIAALETVGQFRVIESEQMQQRRVQIVHVDLVLHDVETEFVGFAESDARFDAAAGHPHRERLRMMIAAQFASGVRIAFHHRRAAEFAAPDDQRVVEQAALFQILDQRGAGLVGLAGTGL